MKEECLAGVAGIVSLSTPVSTAAGAIKKYFLCVPNLLLPET